jgi:hypothetical protein
MEKLVMLMGEVQCSVHDGGEEGVEEKEEEDDPVPFL